LPCFRCLSQRGGRFQRAPGTHADETPLAAPCCFHAFRGAQDVRQARFRGAKGPIKQQRGARVLVVLPFGGGAGGGVCAPFVAYKAKKGARIVPPFGYVHPSPWWVSSLPSAVWLPLCVCLGASGASRVWPYKVKKGARNVPPFGCVHSVCVRVCLSLCVCVPLGAPCACAPPAPSKVKKGGTIMKSCPPFCGSKRLRPPTTAAEVARARGGGGGGGGARGARPGGRPPRPPIK
jgi:hypothetical protein